MPPLVLSSNAHPSYQPFKLNVKTGVDLKMHKVKLPEKPMAPFMRYSKKVFDQVKATNPDLKQWELGRVIQQMWKDLSEQEKQEYINEYENAKFEYCEQLKAFHNSPQYQSFLSNAAKKSKPPIGNGIINPNNINQGVNNNPTLSVISSKSNDLQNNTIYSTALSHYAIEPAEDDGIDESLSYKAQASNRFQRNHRLLNEIFNEFCVQDNRSIVTQQRMEQLKKQVASLETHQEKLKQELAQIEDKYEAKKRKFISSSDEFEKELHKLKEFKISEEQENQFYTKHYDTFQKQWIEYTENFGNSLANKNVNKESAFNLLREGLDNLLNGNSAKSLMSITNPNVVTVVALQQPVETPAPKTDEPTQPHTEQKTATNQLPPPAQNTMVNSPARFNPPNPPNLSIRPNMPAQMYPNQFRSTSTPPINNVNNAIVSPNNQQQNVSNNTNQVPNAVQSPAPQIRPPQQMQPPPMSQPLQQQQIRPPGPVPGQQMPPQPMSVQQIPVQQMQAQSMPGQPIQGQPMQGQAQMMQHGMPMNPNMNPNMNPGMNQMNLNYYHQSQMPMNHQMQMNMYNNPQQAAGNMMQGQPGQQQVAPQGGQAAAQPPVQASQPQFNPNMNMMQQQMNYQGQMQVQQMPPQQQPGQQLPPPPQYPNGMHQQVPPQMQGQMMYPQHQANMPMYNQAGQPQQMMMMQQQQFGNMYQQPMQQPGQALMQPQPGNMMPNQYVNQQQQVQQQQQVVNQPAQQTAGSAAKGDKKSKEDKPKKKSSKKSAANE